MAITTFSGPIKAGTIRNTTGTTVGSDMANVGFVGMSQTATLTQAATTTTTDIIIPANSQIMAIDLTVTTAWSGVAGGTVGIIAASPGTDATRVGKWLDTGTSDHRLIVTTANTGNGVGAVTVRYVQNNNVS